LTAVNIYIVGFCVTTPCSLGGQYECIGLSHSFRPQYRTRKTPLWKF